MLRLLARAFLKQNLQGSRRNADLVVRFSGAQTVNFNAPLFSADNTNGQVNIPWFLTRHPAGTNTVNVVIATNGTAVANVDFLPFTNNTVTFLPGFSNAFFPITLLNNTSSTTTQTLDLALQNRVSDSSPARYQPPSSLLTVSQPHQPRPAGAISFDHLLSIPGRRHCGYHPGPNRRIDRDRLSLFFNRRWFGEGGHRLRIDEQRACSIRGWSRDADRRCGHHSSPGVLKSNQTVNLTLTGSTGAGLGSTNKAVLTILATSSPVIQFSSPDYKVHEHVGSAVVSVIRLGDTSGDSSVSYATSDGTAVNGSITWARMGR